ncbi:hypothetical protein AB4212_62335, partial [Streptomyces sp. 2MCAF27]
HGHEHGHDYDNDYAHGADYDEGHDRGNGDGGGGKGGGEGGERPEVACGDVSGLISAINDANSTGLGVIQLTPNCVYTLTGPAVSPGTNGPDGLPVITGNVTLIGANTTITRGSATAFRIAEVAPGGTLTLNGITVSNGSATTAGTGINGGGILDAGTLRLTSSVVTGNLASNVGGGIEVANNAVLDLTSSQVTHNTAGDGGGIHINSAGTLSATSSQISDNT